MSVLRLLQSLLLLVFFSCGSVFASDCATSLDQLEQLTHSSSASELFPQRLDNRILGRFKGSKGFYVYEYGGRLKLGIDGGLLLGKMVYPLSVCPQDNGSLLIRAQLNGKRESIHAKMILKGKTPGLKLSQGTGKLSGFSGSYLRVNIPMQDIIGMFEN